VLTQFLPRARELLTDEDPIPLYALKLLSAVRRRPPHIGIAHTGAGGDHGIAQLWDRRGISVSSYYDQSHDLHPHPYVQQRCTVAGTGGCVWLCERGVWVTTTLRDACGAVGVGGRGGMQIMERAPWSLVAPFLSGGAAAAETSRDPGGLLGLIVEFLELEHPNVRLSAYLSSPAPPPARARPRPPRSLAQLSRWPPGSSAVRARRTTSTTCG
jgi:hypothetical protein